MSRDSLPPAELSQWIARLRGDDLAPDEFEQLERRLLDDPAARDLYCRQTALDVELSWIYGGAVADIASDAPPNFSKSVTAAPAPTPVLRSRRALGAALALAVAASIALIVWLPGRRGEVALARVIEFEGEAQLMSDDDKTVSLAIGQEILAGQTVRTGGDESFAAVEYPDRTRLELGANTEVRLSQYAADSGTGKQVIVAAGNVRVDAAHQPEGRPLIVAAPHTKINVLGTRFLVSSIDPLSTRVDLEEGNVELIHPEGGPAVEVKAGSYAVTGPDRDAVLVKPLPLVLTQPLGDLNVPSSHYLCYRPDGSLLVPTSREVRFWDPTGVRHESPLGGSVLRPSRSVCSGDGRTLVYCDDGGRFMVWDLVRGAERLTFDTGAEEFQFAVSHDGGRLAVASNPSSRTATIRIWNLADGTPHDLATLVNRRVHFLAISPDGETLAAGLGRGASLGEPTLLLLDTATGTRRETLPTKRDVVRLAFSPDGRRLVSVSEPATVQMWQVADCAVQWTVRVGRQIGCFAFSPDGQYLAGGDCCGRAWLWNADHGGERLLVDVGSKWIWSLSFSPDGRTLATAAHSRPVQLWDVSMLQSEN